MSIPTAGLAMDEQCSALIRRVNQLYHEFTQTSFDGDHSRRFALESPFWQQVARRTLSGRRRPGPAQGVTRTADTRGLVVVDLACGTGFVTHTLSCWLTARDRLVAMDLGEAPLHTTAQKWDRRHSANFDGPQLERVAADAGLLPLADRSVDLLAMNAALHHVPSPRAVLCEIDRVLRPGGFFALGFEPNRTHFASAVMTHLSCGLTRMIWYASPRQNVRRLRDWRAGRARFHNARYSDRQIPDAGPLTEDVLATAINERLLADGLIAESLPAARLLDLVDPHARGRADGVGLDPTALIREAMPDYRPHLLISSDYLGETIRRWPMVRSLVDATLRTVAPRHGSLFSWLLAKPDAPSEVSA